MDVAAAAPETKTEAPAGGTPGAKPGAASSPAGAPVVFQLLDARIVYKTAQGSGEVDCVRLYGRSDAGAAVSVDVTDPEWCFWLPGAVPQNAHKAVNGQLVRRYGGSPDRCRCMACEPGPFGADRPCAKKTRTWPMPVVGMRAEQHKSFVGFSPTPSAFTRVSLSAPYYMREASKMMLGQLREEGYGGGGETKGAGGEDGGDDDRAAQGQTIAYEAHIDAATRFMVDQDILGMTWLEVSGQSGESRAERGERRE